MIPDAAGIEAHEIPPGDMPPGKTIPPPTKGTRLNNWFIEGAMRGGAVEEMSLKSTNSAGTQPLSWACVREGGNTPVSLLLLSHLLCLPLMGLNQ